MRLIPLWKLKVSDESMMRMFFSSAARLSANAIVLKNAKCRIFLSFGFAFVSLYFPLMLSYSLIHHRNAQSWSYRASRKGLPYAKAVQLWVSRLGLSNHAAVLGRRPGKEANVWVFVRLFWWLFRIRRAKLSWRRRILSIIIIIQWLMVNYGKKHTMFICQLLLIRLYIPSISNASLLSNTFTHIHTKLHYYCGMNYQFLSVWNLGEKFLYIFVRIIFR